MTLNKTWKNCLKMWKWIAKEVRKKDRPGVEQLKRQWLEEHGFETGSLTTDNCFFCQYQNTHKRRVGNTAGCKGCPASFVDRSFVCIWSEYDYSEHPIKFYNKLVSLNRKRIKDKKGTK